jgi:hypothetical protein
MYKKYLLLSLCLLLLGQPLFAQEAYSAQDRETIQKLHREALQSYRAYHWLGYLCRNIGGRLSGSPQNAQAVRYTQQILDSLGLDRVFLQEVSVPHWVRGKQEKAHFTIGKKKYPVAVCALGSSVATSPKGLQAPIVEVANFEEMASLGEAGLKGKIVFLNIKMDNEHLQTSTAYGETARFRAGGASEAAKYGAVGFVIRSLTTDINPYPHTGNMRYQEGLPQIPAIAISTTHAEALSQALKKQENVLFYFETHCRTLPDAISHNVIGELKGSERPDEYILVGGHLDAWDLGEGAHDDGTGCVQSIEVLRLYKALGIRPRRTIRVVLFANEENGLRGAQKYAALAKENQEKHIAALESDAGGFAPRGFSMDVPEEKAARYMAWEPLLREFGIDYIRKGGSGADIGPLKPQGVSLFGLRPESQRYFDYHHAVTDTFDKVNRREMQLGAAAMASLIYLLDKYAE